MADHGPLRQASQVRGAGFDIWVGVIANVIPWGSPVYSLHFGFYLGFIVGFTRTAHTETHTRTH